MNGFKDFVMQYRGALIGAVIAILVLFTQLYQFIIGVILIFIGAFIRKLHST